LADSMAYVLQELDSELRCVSKYQDGEVQKIAGYWRDTLRGYCHDNGIIISDLFQ
jgi:hypothetical protein